MKNAVNPPPPPRHARGEHYSAAPRGGSPSGASRPPNPARRTAGQARSTRTAEGAPLRGSARSSSPARGRAVELLHVTGPNGEHAELLVGPAIGGGECMYVKHFVTIPIAGSMEGCQGRTWTGPALRLSTDMNFLSGRVRSDVVAVRLHYASGSIARLQPTRGYVLLTLPAGARI